MAYSSIIKPSTLMSAKLYTGNGNANHAITGVGFQPDWVWIKNRSTANHYLFDVVRGAQKNIHSNENYAEVTEATTLTAFGSDGFTLSTDADLNGNGASVVSWNWKAGTSFTNDASATGIGSIDSTGSVNTNAGFSIISYTGTATNGTIAHGLGVAPSLIIIKNLSTAINWSVNCQPLNASLGDYTRYLTLDSNSGVSGAGNVQYQNSAFTSSVFNVGTNATTNGNGNSMIAYCFAEKQGYSKVGLYTGNGNAGGPFTYLGFKPAFVMIKRTDVSKNWYINDNLRDGYNNDNPYLSPNLTAAETGGTEIDLLSNGFKITASGTGHNASGGTYIYMAFAENPFVASNFNAATAR